MEKSLKWVIAIMLIFFITLLTINLTRKSNKIEYLHYKVRVDSILNDTTHYYKLVDTLHNFNFFEINLRINTSCCYVIVHMKKNKMNYMLDYDLKYSFKIKHSSKQQDSAIMSNLYRLKQINFIAQSKN